jgi:hypothetical protein
MLGRYKSTTLPATIARVRRPAAGVHWFGDEICVKVTGVCCYANRAGSGRVDPALDS